jgi:hypothetical protein
VSGSRAVLERECRTFTRYLAGREASPYVVQKYCDAHPVPLASPADPFERRLMTVAQWHPVAALVADAYARFFAPYGPLRKKLVLLLAILETSPRFFRELDRPPGGGRVAEALRVSARLLVFILALVVGVIVLLPVRLLTRRPDGRAR